MLSKTRAKVVNSLLTDEMFVNFFFKLSKIILFPPFATFAADLRRLLLKRPYTGISDVVVNFPERAWFLWQNYRQPVMA